MRTLRRHVHRQAWGELYRCKTLFLDNFPIFFFYPNGTWTHPPTSKLFLDFWNFFNFAKPLNSYAARNISVLDGNSGVQIMSCCYSLFLKKNPLRRTNDNRSTAASVQITFLATIEQAPACPHPRPHCIMQ